MHELVDEARGIDQHVALGALRKIGMRAKGGGCVMAAAKNAGCEFLGEQVGRLPVMRLGADRGGGAHQDRPPRGELFFLARRLAREHRFAMTMDDQAGRDFA